MPSVDGHHVGVFYAPPFRAFMSGRVEDKSVLHDNASYTASELPTSRHRGYSNPVSMSSLHPSSVSDILYSESSDDQEDYDERVYDTRSLHSAASKDSDSFHTCKGSVKGENNEGDDDISLRSFGKEEADSIADGYSMSSNDESHFSNEGSYSNEQRLEEHRERYEKYMAEKNLTAAIPPSIPYSDYLRRYKVTRSNSEFSLHGSFFHSFLPPSRPKFVPEKVRRLLLHNLIVSNLFIKTGR